MVDPNKLEASRKTLISRIRKKKKKEQGGQWLYSAAYRDKYEFVKKLFRHFCKIPADCCIDTNKLTRRMVYQRELKEINAVKEMT